MAKKKEIGPCHICGHTRELSFEHVPPRAAFNNRPLRVLRGLEIHAAEHDPHHGRVQQRGSGAFTLCGRCNNDTGGWYGAAYADWACHGFAFLPHAARAPSLYLTYRIFPLRVLKQVICMFFSVNTPEFRQSHPYLEKFVMNRRLTGLPPQVQIFCFLTPGPKSRQVGVAGSTNLETGAVTVLSEVTFPPHGYVLCLGSRPPDERLFDITAFATSSFDERREVHLRLPILPVNTAFPGDYRSVDEVMREAAKYGVA